MSSSRQRKVFFIGSNRTYRRGESGRGQTNSLKQFTLVPNKSITRVYPFTVYSLYTDDTLQDIWSAGSTSQGQRCIPNEAFELYLTPIDYFKIHCIKIKQICVSPAGNTTCFITVNNTAYGCGGNDDYQLGLIQLTQQQVVDYY